MATETDYNKLYEKLIKTMPTPEERLEWLKQHQVLAAGPPKEYRSVHERPEDYDPTNKKVTNPIDPDLKYKFNFPRGTKFCVTLKHACDFECEEADNDFLGFALKKEGLYVKGYYKTEAELEPLYENRHHAYNLFVWDREGFCVDGAY